MKYKVFLQYLGSYIQQYGMIIKIVYSYQFLMSCLDAEKCGNNKHQYHQKALNKNGAKKIYDLI